MKIATEEVRSLAVNAFVTKVASREQIAKIFGYTTATISNWVREYKQEKRLAPRPQGHRSAVFTDQELQRLSGLLEANVDLTLAEIKEIFNKTCSLVAIHRTVVKLGFVFKKNSEGKRARERRRKTTS